PNTTAATIATLQALPEPRRSQLLLGDFRAGIEDDAMQVIPTAWVEAAMARGRAQSMARERLSCIGLDVARGGADNTVRALRSGRWLAPLIVRPGTSTPDGPSVAAKVLVELEGAGGIEAAPVHIDVIGVGASAYDFLRQWHVSVWGVN